MSDANVLPTAEPWFAVRSQYGFGVTRIWEPHVHRLLRSNTWHVRGSQRDLVIDSGLGVRAVREALPWMFERDPLLVLTHAHCDHTGAAPEFEERLIHEAEADALQQPAPWSLHLAALAEDVRAAAIALEPVHRNLLIDALPSPSYVPERWRPSRSSPTAVVHDGDLIDLGDRRLRVRHLPGHSPGSIGLLDEHNGILFSGDAIYDGELLDTLDGSNVSDYVTTIRMLRELDIRTVHAGHNESFDGEHLRLLCDRHLERRDHA